MRCQRVEKRIAIQFVMALGANLKGTVTFCPRNAQNNIAVCDLPVVQRHLCPLVHLAVNQFRRTGDTAAIFAAIGKVDPLIAKLIPLAGVWDKSLTLTTFVVTFFVGQSLSFWRTTVGFVRARPGSNLGLEQMLSPRTVGSNLSDDSGAL